VDSIACCKTITRRAIAAMMELLTNLGLIFAKVKPNQGFA